MNLLCTPTCWSLSVTPCWDGASLFHFGWTEGSGGCGLHTYSRLLCTVPQMERRQWECGSPSPEAGIQRSVVAELESGEPSSACLLCFPLLLRLGTSQAGSSRYNLFKSSEPFQSPHLLTVSREMWGGGRVWSDHHRGLGLSPS